MKYLVLFALAACATKRPMVPEVMNARKISGNEEWLNHFQDITVRSGVDSTPTTTVIMGDYNNDGKVDFVAHDRLYENTTRGEQVSFLDVTEDVGLSLSGQPMFMDINNDGHLDVVTTKGHVYLRKNEKYIESSHDFDFKMPEDAFSLGFGDLNGDGYADLIVGRSEFVKDGNFYFVPPKIYYNERGRAFIDVSALYSMETYPAYVRGIHIADYDNDSKPEIYFSNYRLRQNFLFKGRKDIAPELGVQGEYDPERYYDDYYKKKFGPIYGHTIGSVWADMNNDGNLDLFVPNLVHKFVGLSKGSYDYRGYLCDDSKVYKNLGAPDYKFKDMRKTSELPVMPRGGDNLYKGDELWGHATSADFDNDGFLDFYVAQVYDLTYAKAKLFKNKGDFKFKDVSGWTPEVIDSYAAAWGDLNNDGKMDLIISGRDFKGADSTLKILLNIHPTKNNFLKVKLLGKDSGTFPVATQVRVYHDKGLFMRQVDGVTGTFNQQNDPVLHFGLGSVRKIKKIEVRWSSGKKQTLTHAAINTLIKIEEPVSE